MQTSMIVVVLLLCAVEAQSSDGMARQSGVCQPSHEMACFLPVFYQNASGPVNIDERVGKKLVISLEGLSGDAVCLWIRGADTIIIKNGSPPVVLSSLSVRDSGEYTLRCEAGNRTSSSLSVILHVLKRPTTPQITLINVNNPDRSPSFKCVSEGSPKPTLKWSGSNHGTNAEGSSGTGESVVKSFRYADKGLVCCATNREGQECSQLYDYDLETDSMKSEEVSQVTVSPGDSLLLRCRVRRQQSRIGSQVVWEKDNQRMDSARLACPSKIQEEICIRDDAYSNSLMAYLFIESVSKNHNGTYTCRSQKGKTKSVFIKVQAEDFLFGQLDENIIISTMEASNFCLKANISYHPTLQYCIWETPDKVMTTCAHDEWITRPRTVKLCGLLTSGEYKLHLKVSEQNHLTKTIAVCVVDEPKFRFSFNNSGNTFNIETHTAVPANYTWFLCLSNTSCDTKSDWGEMPVASETDSEERCNKKISSSLSRDLLGESSPVFCLTNTVGSWCKSYPTIYHQPSPQGSKDVGHNHGNGWIVMKVGSIFLVLALVIITVVPVHFFRKKKPKYQPHLQMIQIVGPTDNDYIYINFKDFEYETKWEFPRENLELGKELGSGAFGIVVQAKAYGIDKPGFSQQVAVKMLKEKHQTVEKEALMSELKMLTHIGQHINIVNLLGACTESGPIYLIFQYCYHGDLLNYLRNNSERYHKSVTDAFNKDRFRSLYHNLQPKNSSRDQDVRVDHYIPMHSCTTRGQEDAALLNNDYRDMDDVEIYDDDKTDDQQALTFDDLLSFAFQVAKGMEFLSSKNCIHRDLAARNVLVTKGRLVKISDFGLAQDIENDSNYVMKGNVCLPVKWMAPESIFQGMYTRNSDVWAYGILLWEIFSLGVTPYPGMKVDRQFYSMIEKGFKMECPYYADPFAYEIMCKCWNLDPSSRPSFSKLVSVMSDQLMEREEKLYHNMLEQTPSPYQNAQAIMDNSAFTSHSESEAPLSSV